MYSSQIEGFRLSPQQERIWLLQQKESSHRYYVQGEVLLKGSLDISALKKALQTIVNRHEIFRTTFQCLPGMTVPLQVIVEAHELSIHEHTLVDLSPSSQRDESESIFQRLRQKPFRFAENPPFDIELLRLSAQESLLLIRLSALIADGLTLTQLVTEISNEYSSKLQSQEHDLESMQYADVAEWQNELLEQEEYSPGKDYWKNCNMVLSEVSDLSFLGPGKHRLLPNVSIEPISALLTDTLTDKVKHFADSFEVSIHDILLSCWQILLWRVTSLDNLTIGLASSGRSHEELRSTLGILSKYLPLSCPLGHVMTFKEVCEHTSESVNDAYKWQDYFSLKDIPMEHLATAPSVYPFCFEFEEWPEAVCHIGDGISFDLQKRYGCLEDFQISLSCFQKGGALGADLYYDATRYDFSDIKNLSDWFLVLLEDAISHPDQTIGKLNLLSESQRQQVLIDFNQTYTGHLHEQCIHQVFEAQVNQTPDKIAVVFKERQLTYAGLNAKANQLAHYLKELGVTNNQVVGIYLDRSLEFFISLFAILKTGGAYLPLDPALPAESLLFRLQDAQVSMVLSQTDLADALSDCNIEHLCVDKQWAMIAQQSQENVADESATDDLAYVIFTSGSTGKPKGVAVEHRQLFNYSRAIANRLNLSTCKSFAVLSTFSADLGNTAIFPALLSGACLHIISEQLAANPEALADYFHHHPIDCLKIVPSHLSALLTASQPEQILPRQRLILGGEACRWSLIEQIYSYEPSCDIFNHYGPTETTVGVLTHSIDRTSTKPLHQENVPIGRPIANTQAYLLNADLQPVPIGVPGELYIGGASVARGYLNRPQLTAERFINNPFEAMSSLADLEPSSLPSPILYKTGDLARYQLDGTIEFLGRVDNQVKIRGYRVELGEIENAIRQHAMVQDTVVVTRTAQSGNQRLIAYIVPQKLSNLTSSEVRDMLKDKLLDYMVPAAFVMLKMLPLTPNGKIDRQALPAPESTPSEQQVAFVAPSTEIEKTLAQIWAKTLGFKKIGIHDNFFELGGDSILSIQIVARANQSGLKLTPKQVFENQTIAELADVANHQQAIQAEQGLVIGDIPLTPIQHWFFAQQLPETHHWNQSILLDVQEALDFEHLQLAMQALLEHHDALRLRFSHGKTGWRQYGVEPDGALPLTKIDLSAVPVAEQGQVISTVAAELQASLDLTAGPLLRVAYFDLGEHQPDRLLMVIHHLAVDGVSWRILLEDLQIAQQQINQGRNLQLPDKTTSFQYWSTQLAEYAQAEALQQEVDYWLSPSSRSVTPVPKDFPESNNTVGHADSISVALSEAETVALLQEVPATYQTQINDVLLTALVQAFAQWTGEQTLLIDLEGHGREDLFPDVDLSRTVGWFTSIFPVTLDISASTAPGDAIKAIKEQLREIPNRGIGYGILRYLSNNRADDWQQRPQAEVRFNYLGQTDQALQQSPLFTPAKESTEPGRSLKGTRPYVLDVNSIVAGGQLHIDWTYSTDIHRPATIEALATNFIEALRSLITHCQSPNTGGYTPSDFSEANLNQQELDQFLAKITGKS